MDLTTNESAGVSNSPTVAQTAPLNEAEPTHRIPLPDTPLVAIEPSRSWVKLSLRDLWTYRELLYFLIWRDVKVRYKQTALGIAWAVLQPLFTMLIFTIIFGRLAGISSGNVPYPIFAYAALLPWTFFSNAITNSSNSLVGNANLITKVYFPRMVIPAASVGAGLVDFAIAFITFIGLQIYYDIALTWNILILPLLLALTTLLALGVGMWTSALNVKYRDIRHALPFLIQIWMFVSPIIYSARLLSGKWKWLFALNPLTGIIEGYRAALLGQAFPWSWLALSTLITVITVVFAAYYFRQMEKSFADII